MQETDKVSVAQRRTNIHDAQEQWEQEREEDEKNGAGARSRKGHRHNLGDRQGVGKEESVERNSMGQVVAWELGGMQKICRVGR